MNKEKYRDALGCVVSYKPYYEPLLFNELNARCAGIKLLDRGSDSAAFTVSDYDEVVSNIHEEGFIFLQHIHPFMSRTEIQGNDNDFKVFIEMTKNMEAYLSSDDKLICQCRIASNRTMEYSNVDLTNLLLSYFENKDYIIAPQEADMSISLTVLDNFAYMGVSRLTDNASERTGGILFYSKKEDSICRAEFKIEEAFSVFGIKAAEGMNALDLGAAPGGWTNYLCHKGIAVDAVDPANLDESVESKKNVKHYKMTAQQFAAENPDKDYDIIVNDMKMDTNQSIDILCGMSRHLKAEGVCLLTLKLPKKDIQKRINTAKKVLSGRFEVVKVRQLYYNRSEVTVFVKNKLT